MKKIITAIVICVLAVLPACSAESGIEMFLIQGDAAQLDYFEINELSPIIVKAKVLDNYSEEAAHIIEENSLMMGFYGERKIKILECYKNETELNLDELTIIEPAALSNSKLFCMEGYTPLVQGDEYILYLSNETGSGDWSVVGFGNGNVNLNNIMESENYLDVAIKSIANYESNLNTAQKELILSADEITLDSVSSTGEIVLQMTHDGEVNSFSMVPDNLTYYIESETARFSVKEE